MIFIEKIKRFFFNILPKASRNKLLFFISGSKLTNKQFSLNHVLANSKKVLFILPEDLLNSTLVIPAVQEIKNLFPDIKSYFLANSNISNTLNCSVYDGNIISYNNEDVKLFSNSYYKLYKKIFELKFDTSFTLDENINLSRTYLIYKAGIPIRIAPTSFDAQYFTNINTKTVLNNTFFLDSIYSVPKCFGSKNNPESFKFNIPEYSIIHSVNALKNLGIDINSSIISVSYLIKPDLLKEILLQFTNASYSVVLIINKESSESIKLSHPNLPSNVYFFHHTTIQETIGLLKLSDWTITSNDYLAYLSAFSGNNSICCLNDKSEKIWKNKPENLHYKYLNGSKPKFASEIFESVKSNITIDVEV